MNVKEQWTERTLGSLDGIRRAELSREVREKILQTFTDDRCQISDIRYQSSDIINGTVRSSLVWKLAAVILLLISLNVFTMVYYSRTSGNAGNGAKSVASEYFSYMDNFNL